MDESGGRRARNRERTRARLQAAALELFARQGFDATTVEQIADAAEVAPRTFFRYFPTKEAVLHDEDASFAAMEAAVGSTDEDAPLLEVFDRMARAALAVEQLTSDQLRLRYQLMQTVPAVAARFLANLQHLQALLTDVIARKLDVDPVDDPRASALAGALVGTVHGLMLNWLRHRPDASVHDFLARSLSVLDELPDLLRTR